MSSACWFLQLLLVVYREEGSAGLTRSMTLFFEQIHAAALKTNTTCSPPRTRTGGPDHSSSGDSLTAHATATSPKD